MRINIVVSVLLLVSGLAAGAYAQNITESIVVLPNEMLWKPTPVSPGLEIAVLYGDPPNSGVYVQRVRFPAGLKLMPHFHPDEWRTGVVLSGNYYFGLGEQWDESKLRLYPPGTFFSEWAKDGEVMVQFTAMGPTGITRIPQKQ
jgi:hypothetical protein